MGEFRLFLEYGLQRTPILFAWSPGVALPDSVNSNQLLESKEGIEKIASGKVFNRQWRVKLF